MKKSELLSEFFASEFIIEPEGQIPKFKDKVACEKIMDLDISIKDVYKN